MSIDEDRIISLKYQVAKLKEKDDYNLSMLAKLQRDYSHLLKQKKDCEESKYKLQEDIENGTSHLERLLFKYDKVREEWGQLKYTLDEIKELVRERRRNGEIELAEIFETILAKHEDKNESQV
jgi:peptidoglycan hydrolase CwlO-like protein